MSLEGCGIQLIFRLSRDTVTYIYIIPLPDSATSELNFLPRPLCHLVMQLTLGPIEKHNQHTCLTQPDLYQYRYTSGIVPCENPLSFCRPRYRAFEPIIFRERRFWWARKSHIRYVRRNSQISQLHIKLFGCRFKGVIIFTVVEVVGKRIAVMIGKGAITKMMYSLLH